MAINMIICFAHFEDNFDFDEEILSKAKSASARTLIGSKEAQKEPV